jgi:hypothetical protein
MKFSFPAKMYIKIKRVHRNNDNDNNKTDVVWVKINLYKCVTCEAEQKLWVKG